MKTFEITLTKSYVISIKAENEISAKEFAEYFTSDIQNISTQKDESNYNFKIENIECKFNEAIDAVELS